MVSEISILGILYYHICGKNIKVNQISIYVKMLTCFNNK